MFSGHAIPNRVQKDVIDPHREHMCLSIKYGGLSLLEQVIRVVERIARWMRERYVQFWASKDGP